MNILFHFITPAEHDEFVQLKQELFGQNSFVVEGASDEQAAKWARYDELMPKILRYHQALALRNQN